MGEAAPNVRFSEALRGQLYMLLQSVRGRPFGRFMREIQALEALDPAEFDRSVEEQLAWMLGYAKENVPFYQQAGAWQEAVSGGG